MTTSAPNQDPMEFLKGFWGNMGFPLPGMVTPTVDTDELGKRIADLKAVEVWLKSNLSMLQMTIQGLEMQRATLATLQTMSQQAASGDAGSNPFLNTAMWPWNMVPPAAEGSESEKSGKTEPADAPEAASTGKRKPKR